MLKNIKVIDPEIKTLINILNFSRLKEKEVSISYFLNIK